MHASRLIRRLFALPPNRRVLPPVPADVVIRAYPAAGNLTLVGGASGGGKSRLLAALRDRRLPGVRWIEPATLPLGEDCVVDRMCDELEAAGGEGKVELALELLSRVGLAEAWTYLQTPAELSDGQRWRLRLALAVAQAMRPATRPTSPVSNEVLTIIAIDEFAALLDRVTARVVARALRRLIDRPCGDGESKLAAVVVTSHDDLTAALSPDCTVTADFGVYTVRA